MEEIIIPKVETRVGSIATVTADAIVNPTNSFGYMGSGVGKAIKLLGGETIEDEAISQAPIEVGTAALTTSGDLVCKAIIHAPIIHDPDEKIDSHKIICAIEAALELADSEQCRSIALPGMKLDTDDISKKELAKITIDTIKKFKFKSVEMILLIDKDKKLIAEFEKILAPKKSKK